MCSNYGMCKKEAKVTCQDGGGKAVNVMTMLPTAYTDDR